MLTAAQSCDGLLCGQPGIHGAIASNELKNGLKGESFLAERILNASANDQMPLIFSLGPRGEAVENRGASLQVDYLADGSLDSCASHISFLSQMMKHNSPWNAMSLLEFLFAAYYCGFRNYLRS